MGNGRRRILIYVRINTISWAQFSFPRGWELFTHYRVFVHPHNILLGSCMNKLIKYFRTSLIYFLFVTKIFSFATLGKCGKSSRTFSSFFNGLSLRPHPIGRNYMMQFNDIWTNLTLRSENKLKAQRGLWWDIRVTERKKIIEIMHFVPQKNVSSNVETFLSVFVKNEFCERTRR